MKKAVSLLLTVLLLSTLSACGGAPAARKGTAGGAPTVSQIMEGAAADEAPLPPSAADAALSSSVPEQLSGAAERQPRTEELSGTDGVDVDLTRMNATMVFAEVSNIMYMPEDYIGKIIRMNGMAVSSDDPETDVTYHAVIIRDATACCASGLDYILTEGQEYPPDETDVTVTGEFELYEENGFFYCQLKDAVLGV